MIGGLAGVTFHLRTVLNCFKLLRRNYGQNPFRIRARDGGANGERPENFTAALGTQFVLGSRRPKSSAALFTDE